MTTFEEKFEEWVRAPKMTVEEIRALGHRWVSCADLGAGPGITWLRCSVCGALCPSDLVETPSQFRKFGNSLLTTPHD